MATLYKQKIYDTTVGWCFYELATVTASPTSGQTTPNHTNNLVAASHTVLDAAADPSGGGGSGVVTLWEWNGTDLSQLSLGGATGNWNVTYSATGGPTGEPCIVCTTTSNAAGDLYIYPTSQPTLGDYYTMEIGLGPYTGQSANAKRCLPCPAFAFMDTSNWYGFGPAADNTGGGMAANIQWVQRSSGSITAGNLVSTFGNQATAKGLVRATVAIGSTTSIVAGFDTIGAQTAYQYAGPTNTGRGIGLRVAHYGQSQAIGDSTYVYGWKVLGEGSF